MQGYLDPVPYLITNPAGIDREVQKVQVKLKNDVSWLQACFGRAFKQESLFDTDKVRYERRHYYPECYLENMEPINVLPNDNMRSLGFFYTEDPAIVVGEYAWNQPVSYKYRTHLIMWANLNKIDASADWRFTEHLKNDVLAVLNTFPNVAITELYDSWLGVLQEYTINDTFKQSTRPPYTGFRIVMDITFTDKYNCG